MSARTRSAVLALAAASALVLGGAAVPAVAGNPADNCSDDADYTSIYTAGAWWLDVCLNSATVEDGETTSKSDAFDSVGYLTALGALDVPLLAPDSAITSGYSGSTFTSSWTDAGVDLGGGDVVDVSVDLTFAGTYVQWNLSTVETGTATPAVLPLAWGGGLGSDGQSTYAVTGDQMISYGDADDPILLWDVQADTALYDVTDGNDSVTIEAEGADITVTIALLDFGCPATMNEPGAFTYAQSIVGTFASTFGESLQVPGTEPCIDVSPLTVAPGAPLDHALSIVYTGIEFESGGSGSYWVYDYTIEDDIEIQVEGANEAGTTPTFFIVGTAPTVPGTYWIGLYAWNQDQEVQYGTGHLQLVVEAPAGPQLAATGADVPWGIGAVGALALVAGIGALTIRRRVQA